MSADAIDRLTAALSGRYRVDRELGEGGMATVYLAEDVRHERRVALKVLKPELAAVVGADRFLAEIKTTANLQHPHILPLHDSGEADGFLFYVMPYVEGESLRARLEREHQLPVDEALAIATDVAEGLEYAHAQGVVHRDIKPANILLQAGKPVISDFGIALAVGVAGGGRLTETGLSLGTPHYMSPEQATGDQSVGVASDVYALGCVLYEMLVGEPPYTGSTAQAILGKIIQAEPVSATAARRSVPAHVDSAIRRSLEKLAADRFTSARDFAAALANAGFRHGEAAASGVAGASGAWNRLSMGLAAVAVLTSGVAAWALLRPDPVQPPTRHVLSTEGWAAVGGPPFGEYAALAPDGSSMILPLENQLGLKMRNSVEITPIPGTESARNPVYSPEGDWIAYAVDTEVFKRPLIGGSPVRVAEGTEAEPFRVGLAWLDDGTMLYEPGEGGQPSTRLVHISEDGGEPLAVLEMGGAIVWVHGLPGSRGALVVRANNTLHVLDLRERSSEQVLDEVVRAWYARTGHIVYVRGDGALFAVPFDVDGLRVTGTGTPLFEGVRATAATADMYLADDGTLLYAEGGAAGVGSPVPVRLDRDGVGEALDPSVLTGVFGTPAVSPDGRRIALERETPGEGTQDIWIYDLDQQLLRRLSFAGEVNRYPFWSPDGREVGFTSDRDGTPALYVRPWDLSEETRLLLADPEGEPLFEGSWTPDGSRLLFRRGSVLTPEPVDIAYASLHPDSAVVLLVDTDATEQNPTLSPDGEWLAYASNQSGREEVYVRPFPGTGAVTQVSRSGARNPVWGPAGGELFYLNMATQHLTVASYRTEPAFAVESREDLFFWRSYLFGAAHPEWDVAPEGYVVAIGSPPTQVEGASRIILVMNFLEELSERVSN